MNEAKIQGQRNSVQILGTFKSYLIKEYFSIRNLKNKNKTQAYTFCRDRLLLIVLAEILCFFKHEEQNSCFHLYNEISPGRKKEFTIATGKNMEESANNDAR